MELTTSCPPWLSLLLLSLSTLSLCSLLVLLLSHSIRGRGRHKQQEVPPPPGPATVLFVAKQLALRRPMSDISEMVRELHARYGPVVWVRLFRPLVFVSDRHLAHRVLVQSGATFADRPEAFDPGLLFSSGGRIIFSARYGPYWRLIRRNLASEVLHPAHVSLWAPARRWAREALATDLRLRGGDGDGVVTVRPLFQRALFDLLAYMSFGARLAPEVLEEIEQLQQLVVRSFMTYPIFYHWPSLTKRLFHRRWGAHVAVRRKLDDIFLPLIHARRSKPKDGMVPPCYVDSLLALRVPEEGNRPLTDGELASLCLEFLSAGNDGTLTLLEWIMAELVNSPDVQARVYEEETRRSNRGQGDDLPSYLNAVVLEALRLHPPIHFLVPHGVHGAADSEIGGYKVPQGAEVNILVADIGRDETLWTAAREFRPERFLNGGEGCDVDITGTKEIKMMPFGAGRRMCPAYTLAMLHVAYFVGGLVRELDWQPPAVGDQVDMTETLNFTSHMKHPLRARIIPRT